MRKGKLFKKHLRRLVLYIAVIIAIPYGYFLWQAKQAVETFISLHPIGGELTYEWLWVDLDGVITLETTAFYQDINEPTLTADSIQIVTTSIFDLLDVKEHLVYNEYPSTLQIKLNRAKSAYANKLIELAGLNYNENYMGLIYPEDCLTAIDKKLPFVEFNWLSRFSIQRTADIAQVDFSFDSHSLASMKGRFIINNLTATGEDESFISDLQVNLENLTFLQQSTQKCLAELNIDKVAFSDRYAKHLEEASRAQSLLMENSAVTPLIEFVYAPQSIGLSFSLLEGKTFSQLPIQPFYQFQKDSGLVIKLNNKTISTLFQSVEMVPDAEPEQESTAQTNKAEEQPKFLPKRIKVLKNYLSSKVTLHLKNKTAVTGYIERVSPAGIQLLKHEYKGETLLPYPFAEIDSIELLLAEVSGG